MMNATGFLCEIKESRDRLRVFDCKTQRLINWRSYEGAKLELGKLYKLGHKKVTEKKTNKFGKNVKFFTVNRFGQVLVRATTWATSPKVDEFPEELRMKYQGKVWSPFFGYLGDPKGLFLNKFKGGECGWVSIEFCLTADYAFKIVVAHELNQDPELTEQTPWGREFDDGEILTDEEDVAERELQKVNTTKRVQENAVALYALCIQTNIQNPNYNPKAHGSYEKCDMLFHHNIGVYRNLRDAAKFGVWYRHTWRDDRKKYKCDKNGIPRTAYDAVYAVDIDSIADPIKTRVNRSGEIEVTVDFLFNPDTFETAQNREIKEWNIRRQGLNVDASIWNKYLGVVEFEFKVKEFIVKTIEDYKATHSHRSAVRNSHPIGVTVIVVPQKDIHEYAQKYPKRGLFIARTVDYIRYKEGGPVLFDSYH